MVQNATEECQGGFNREIRINQQMEPPIEKGHFEKWVKIKAINHEHRIK